jgi:hypothetical protein
MARATLTDSDSFANAHYRYEEDGHITLLRYACRRNAPNVPGLTTPGYHLPPRRNARQSQPPNTCASHDTNSPILKQARDSD